MRSWLPSLSQSARPVKLYPFQPLPICTGDVLGTARDDSPGNSQRSPFGSRATMSWFPSLSQSVVPANEYAPEAEAGPPVAIAIARPSTTAVRPSLLIRMFFQLPRETRAPMRPALGAGHPM